MSEEEKASLRLLQRLEGDLNETLGDLDQKLHRVLAKQEYDYMKCYTMFIKRKERELRELVAALSARAKEADRDKDLRITQLEAACRQAIANETQMDKKLQEMKAQVLDEDALLEAAIQHNQVAISSSALLLEVDVGLCILCGHGISCQVPSFS
jgi:hypothetical protein